MTGLQQNKAVSAATPYRYAQWEMLELLEYVQMHAELLRRGNPREMRVRTPSRDRFAFTRVMSSKTRFPQPM
jgi:hypothetical protein